MNLEASEDIVERALLSLLTPKAPPILEGKFVRKKKFRKTKGRVSQSESETIANELMPARISIVERLSSVTLSICWSDATSGHFAEQVWRMGLAHARSFCALSGMPIGIGDSVLRPWVCETRTPANSHRMILASSVGMSFPRRTGQ
ncbi:DUF3331 domain-containing protein [Burkholderia sp. Ac-20365]|uniref:DUF3331 domain-containing protein n=1 Tax=Burkholderia sp. Ac-20365 TaxID=2703897 RepID=UPI00197BEB73|nr:DUF3331 domain-containing protein [Burkholderia sp. Ac-20365]MBN3759251.1 DUF3331 domain-containing protein [Burkholderia sp. Ac-20365]